MAAVELFEGLRYRFETVSYALSEGARLQPTGIDETRDLNITVSKSDTQENAYRVAIGNLTRTSAPDEAFVSLVEGSVPPSEAFSTHMDNAGPMCHIQVPVPRTRMYSRTRRDESCS